MGKFSGKKLLVLGSSVGSTEIVDYARREGAWVIVTDYLPTEKSAAKKLADETVMVSTIDVDALCALAEEKKIDGIFCGVSEMNLVSMEQVARRLHLPCYFTKDQWNICQHKSRFKALCREYGVPVPRDFTQAVKDGKLEAVSFPVIVKPVDSSAGRGIRICHRAEEVKDAYDYALTFSPSKTVLVEEFVSGKNEITATYTLKDGEISLSCLKDKLISLDHENITAQVDVLIAPSAFLPRYLEQVNEAVIRMLKGIGAKEGCVFIQGIADEERFTFFEMGYRINGGSDYRLIAAENGINYLEMMVCHAITGKTEGFDLSLDDPYFRNHVLTFNMYIHGGTIGSMEGREAVAQIPNVLTCEYMRKVGDTVKEDNTLSQRGFRAVIRDGEIDAVKETITKIQQAIRIRDVDGNDMLYKPFDVQRLAERCIHS